MYTSIRRYNVTPDAPDAVNQIIRRAERGFVPIISKAQGFVAYDIVDTGDNTLISISTFESADGAEQSDKMAAGWVKENVAMLVTGPPMIASGSVGLHKTK